MTARNEIVSFINEYLKSEIIKDSSQNGLQVEGKDDVKKIVFGVSANLEFFKRAVVSGADMAIVHHGILWSDSPRVTGVFRRRVKFLLENNINLCAWHLPLDMHEEVGNNARIAEKLGLKKLESFGEYHGVKIGFCGVLKAPLSLKEIEDKIGFNANTIFDFGPREIRKIAVVSGGGQDMFRAAADAHADLFITGSAEEFVQEYARETGVNFMAIGHYNSETFGVKALMEVVRKKFKVAVEFIDVENRL
ncbi:MAG: Nif3-like dinuclear metal center hexameric protein [Elusimicrobia bacterium]|nr:Nif3-like dinuclear metal center hexameric protein [Elusimicrobiota bacterium]